MPNIPSASPVYISSVSAVTAARCTSAAVTSIAICLQRSTGTVPIPGIWSQHPIYMPSLGAYARKSPGSRGSDPTDSRYRVPYRVPAVSQSAYLVFYNPAPDPVRTYFIIQHLSAYYNTAVHVQKFNLNFKFCTLTCTCRQSTYDRHLRT